MATGDGKLRKQMIDRARDCSSGLSVESQIRGVVGYLKVKGYSPVGSFEDAPSNHLRKPEARVPQPLLPSSGPHFPYHLVETRLCSRPAA